MNVEKLSDFSVKIGVSGADLKRRSINMHKINMDYLNNTYNDEIRYKQRQMDWELFQIPKAMLL